MTVIANIQGAVKASEIAIDEALSNIGTSVSEDGLTVLKQIYQLALDGNQEYMAFSDGRIKWSGTSLSFNQDGRYNTIYVRLLKLDGPKRTVDLAITGGVNNSEFLYNDIPLEHDELLYIELSRAEIEASTGVIQIRNAVNGGSIVSGKTLKKIALSSSSGMPAISIGLNGESDTLNIPVAFRYDWQRGSVQNKDCMWACNGERWKLDSILELGSSVALSQGGAIPNFLEVSDKAWDAEVDTSGWYIYNDSSAFPVDGEGGTINPSISFVLEPDMNKVLSGTSSFSFKKTAVTNVLGHGIAVDFQIPKGYRRKKLHARFLYDFLSGYSNGMMGVYVIADPLGAKTLITPYQNMLVAPKGEIVAPFNPIEDISTYRLCIHIGTNYSAALEFILDEVKINPIYYVTSDTIASPAQAGFVQEWAGTSDIEGWFICNGRSLTKDSYPELFNNIGYTYGGSGANFNIPDLRGVFVRGLDAGRGLDSGRGLGTYQGDTLQSHTHTALGASAGANGYSGGPNPTMTPLSSNTTSNASGSTSSETRPKNVALNYLIKIYNDKKNSVLSNSHVEYASNTNAGLDVSDTRSFFINLQGSPIPSFPILTECYRRVAFSRNITNSDRIFIQVDNGTGGVIWVDAAQVFPFGKTSTGTTYGIWYQIVAGQPNQIDIYFGNAGQNAFGDEWANISSIRWRVCLTANPNAVEFTLDEIAGVIKLWGGSVAPTGYLLCQGQSLLRSAYPNLFAAIGTQFGAPSATTFSLPDFRGVFPRGLDAGRDLDSGRTLGTYQGDDFASHYHVINLNQLNSNGDGGWGRLATGGQGPEGAIPNINSYSTGGSETRPKNISINFIIKI